MPPIASPNVEGTSVDYLVNGLMGLGIGLVLLASSGVLARGWVAFSNAEWETHRASGPCAGSRRRSPLAASSSSRSAC